jgi:hypothetical protein
MSDSTMRPTVGPRARCAVAALAGADPAEVASKLGIRRHMVAAGGPNCSGVPRSTLASPSSHRRLSPPPARATRRACVLPFPCSS